MLTARHPPPLAPNDALQDALAPLGALGPALYLQLGRADVGPVIIGVHLTQSPAPPCLDRAIVGTPVATLGWRPSSMHPFDAPDLRRVAGLDHRQCLYQFVVGETIEDTYETLRQRWFGTIKGLHLDSYVALKYVDGFRIELILKMSTDERAEYTYYLKKVYNDRDELQAAESRGLEKGKAEGEAKERRKVALKMLAKNKPDDEILEFSGITPDELAELKQNIYT
jgi:hypothetical protein